MSSSTGHSSSSRSRDPLAILKMVVLGVVALLVLLVLMRVVLWLLPLVVVFALGAAAGYWWRGRGVGQTLGRRDAAAGSPADRPGL